MAIKVLKPAEFPAALREISDPPSELFLAGRWPGEDWRYLTVVGARKCSSYGREVCQKLIGELAGQPVAIISGLALGIDTVAHQAALATKLPTVAVPGSGLGRAVLHPHSNLRLADKIVAAGGALLSEFPPDYPAAVHTFPRRNRIMAGLSRAVLVIEADERSGTLITARLALDYNRDVLAVPGSIFSPLSRGTLKLIRQGATPVSSGSEILEVLGLTGGAVSQAELIFDELSPLEKIIVTALRIEPLERDELIRQTGRGAAETNAILMGLEVKGVIVESVGQIRLNSR